MHEGYECSEEGEALHDYCNKCFQEYCEGKKQLEEDIYRDSFYA